MTDTSDDLEAISARLNKELSPLLIRFLNDGCPAPLMIHDLFLAAFSIAQQMHPDHDHQEITDYLFDYFHDITTNNRDISSQFIKHPKH